jgi:RNA-directed DNA polymerase
VLSLRWSAPWLLDGDSRACFDRIAHDWFLAHIPLEQAILRPWLTAGCMDQHVLSPTATGVPQGGRASPVLMPVTLHGLERPSRGAFPRCQGSQRTQGHVSRCADDGIITGRTRAFLEQEVSPLVAPCLSARGLELAHAKPRITPIEDGCDFLGTPLRTSHGKLLCTPAKKNVPAFLETIRHLVKHQKPVTAGHLILPRKPVIRGGAQSHQHGASQRPCATVDHHLFPLLWQWAQRRHPHTARWWIKETYVRSAHGNNWVCFGHVMRPPGRGHDVRLFRASRVPMRRHPTSQGEAHPYDPQWEPSFAARAGVRMARNLQGRRQLWRLWKAQEGLCAVCQQRITELTGWQSHPSVWRTHGGSDRADNRVLLHPHGHAQVHTQR